MKKKQMLLVGCSAIAAVACALVVASPMVSLLQNTKATTDKTLNITSGSGNIFTGSSLLDYTSSAVGHSSTLHSYSISSVTSSPMLGGCFSFSDTTTGFDFSHMEIGGSADSYILHDYFEPSVISETESCTYVSHLLLEIGAKNITSFAAEWNTNAPTNKSDPSFSYKSHVVFYNEDYSASDEEVLGPTLDSDPATPQTITNACWAVVNIQMTLEYTSKQDASVYTALFAYITDLKVTWSC